MSDANFKNDHHLIHEKVVPDSLLALRQELLLPHHRDIFLAAQKERSFEEALGMIAAKLDILLDGDYNVPDLCELLVKALRTRALHGNNPAAIDPRLIAVEIVEKKDVVSVEFAGAHIDPNLVTPVPTFDGFSHWMREQGCTICESRSACGKAGKCLGKEAFEVGLEMADAASKGKIN